MLNAFWEGVASALATRWVQRVFAPAFIFWAGGFLCLVWRDGWDGYEAWWNALDSGQLLLLITGALVLVAASGTVIQRLDGTMLRWLEGYWPAWPIIRGLRRWLTVRYQRSIEEAEQTVVSLTGKAPEELTFYELVRLNKAEDRIGYAPRQPHQLMPTRLGNILRASERRPRARYGLETVYVWPRLWLLLPEQAREDVANAREALNSSVRLVAWGLLFILWSWVAWWAFIPGLLVAVVAYHWAMNQAKTYGDLLVACFDLYRFDLYRALHWPLPANSATEKSHGERLTQYLYRGYASDPIFFEPRAGDKGRAF